MSVPLIIVAFYINLFRDTVSKFFKAVGNKVKGLVGRRPRRRLRLARPKNHDYYDYESDSDWDPAATRTPSLSLSLSRSRSRADSETVRWTVPATGRVWLPQFPSRGRNRLGRVTADDLV